jgi:hypothetical protein
MDIKAGGPLLYLKVNTTGLATLRPLMPLSPDKGSNTIPFLQRQDQRLQIPIIALHSCDLQGLMKVSTINE